MVVGTAFMLGAIGYAYLNQGDWWLIPILLFIFIMFAVSLDDLLSGLKIEKDQHSLYLTYKTYFPFKKNKKIRLKEIIGVSKDRTKTDYKGNVLYSYHVVLNLKQGVEERLLTARNEDEADRIIKLIKWKK